MSGPVGLIAFFAGEALLFRSVVFLGFVALFAVAAAALVTARRARA